MATEVLKLTAADLEFKIVPVAGEYTFSIGDDVGDSMTTARAEEVLLTAERRVLGRLPAKYARLVLRIDGEMLAYQAAGGETSFTTGLNPISNLRLWKNFTFKSGWKTRSAYDAMNEGDYTVNDSTGAITLVDALNRGDQLIADYDHQAGADFLTLRHVVLSLAAAEVSRMFAYFENVEGFERFEQWETNAWMEINKMKGIPEIDRLRLFDETDEDDHFSAVLNMPTTHRDKKFPNL